MIARGLVRGLSSRPVDEVPNVPRLLDRAENAATAQTGVTTVTDLSGLAVSFTVTDYPVEVVLDCPLVYGGNANDMTTVLIADAANSSKSEASVTHTSAAGVAQLRAVERITTPGSYQRKGRIRRNSGTGSANTLPTATTVFFIEAVEQAD